MGEAVLFLGCTAVGAAREYLFGNQLPRTGIDDIVIRDGIDAVRDIVEAVTYRPTSRDGKTLLVPNVGRVSSGAFIALDKVIESVPDFLRIAICAPDPSNVPISVFKHCRLVIAD